MSSIRVPSRGAEAPLLHGINLRGTEAQARDPAEVLAEFLRALGVEGSAVPERLEERMRLFRAWLADWRVLVVLDNAASEAQVRPLLPGGPGCGCWSPAALVWGGWRPHTR